MTKSSTRKMLCALKKDGTASTHSEHLVPCFTRENPVFIGIKTGKEYLTGYISYLGCDVSTDDILVKLDLATKEAKQARPILDEYLSQLQEFKIGNVLSLSWKGIFKKLSLKKEAEKPPSGKKKSRLP